MESAFFALDSQVFDRDQSLVAELKTVPATAKYIVAPVHLPNHWILLAIDVCGNRSIILDSLFDPTKSGYVLAFKRSYKIIQVLNSNGFKIATDQHKFFLSSDCPQQPVGSLDCGAYVVYYLIYLIKRDLSIFSQSSDLKRFTLNNYLSSEEIDISPLGNPFSSLCVVDPHATEFLKKLRSKRAIKFEDLSFDLV